MVGIWKGVGSRVKGFRVKDLGFKGLGSKGFRARDPEIKGFGLRVQRLLGNFL